MVKIKIIDHLVQIMSGTNPLNDNPYPFLAGGGEMGALIRAFDWSATPLGEPVKWPIALKIQTAVLLASPFPMHIAWGDKFIQLYNDSYRQALGISKHPQALGKPFYETFPETWETIGPMFNGVMAGESFCLLDLKPVLDRNGHPEEYYFEVAYSPVPDENGIIGGVLTSAFKTTDKQKEQDIHHENLQAINEEMAASNEELVTTNEELIATQHLLQKINNKLAASESRLRMAIESTNLGTWDYNPVSGALYWSIECRNVYGIPAEEPVTFETFSDHIHPDDRAWVNREIALALEPDNGNYDLSFQIIRFDNREIRWIKVQGNVFFVLDKPIRFIGTVLDITDLKQAEEKSAKLGAIIASSDDAIISKTLESVITSWNDSAERIFGYTAAEMIGETIYKLIPVNRQEEEPQILARLKSGERVEHFETQRLTKDGKLLDVSVTVSPVKDSQGNIIGLSKIARDITEKKLDETRKSDFIGMVSHELKTPLTSLNAIIQVAHAKLKNSEDTFLFGAMQKANAQVKKMTGMINGFLNVSMLESGKIQMEKQPFDLEALISEILDETRLTASTHFIQFHPCQPVPIIADRDKISSVISNLIGNAVKYSPKGKHVDIGCSTEKGRVVVSVKDEGMGIKPHDISMIFDRYYRVQATNTQHISGFGIGLYLSAEIVKRHNGDIWVESEIGKGSTFYFSLTL